MGAQLTIIAATGDHANSGLPGISVQPRRHQAKVSVSSQGISLWQIFPHTANRLVESPWAGRGWTFQEGYLSRRRLIFTDHQVSFLCNTMFATESVRQAPFTLTPVGIAVFQNIIPSTETWKHFPKLITEYTTRRLRYSSDALLALLGILHSLETAGVRHLWGVPFDAGRIALDWHHGDTVATRRAEFPSWSWAGWDGKAQVFWKFHDELLSKVYMKDDHQELQEIGSFRVAFHTQLPTPKHMYISAPVISLSFKNIIWDNDRKSAPTIVKWQNKDKSYTEDTYKLRRSDGLHIQLPISPHLAALAYVHMDDTQTPLDGLMGLALERKSSLNGPYFYTHYHSILVIKGTSDGSHERVGMAWVRPFEVAPHKHWQGLHNPPMAFADDDGNLLDNVDIPFDGTEHEWIKGLERQLIKLE